jgi:hypothetical protein
MIQKLLLPMLAGGHVSQPLPPAASWSEAAACKQQAVARVLRKCGVCCRWSVIVYAEFFVLLLVSKRATLIACLPARALGGWVHSLSAACQEDATLFLAVMP